jgi:hypothetical protein
MQCMQCGSAFVERFAGTAAGASLAGVDYVGPQSRGGAVISVPPVRRVTLVARSSCKTPTTHNII